MILILIFAEVLGLYGLIVALILSTKWENMNSSRTSEYSSVFASSFKSVVTKKITTPSLENWYSNFHLIFCSGHFVITHLYFFPVKRPIMKLYPLSRANFILAVLATSSRFQWHHLDLSDSQQAGPVERHFYWIMRGKSARSLYLS